MSLQATEASWELAAAREKMAAHVLGCYQCARPRRKCDPCPAGRALADEVAAGMARVRREKELDAQPCEGQGVLF